MNKPFSRRMKEKDLMKKKWMGYLVAGLLLSMTAWAGEETAPRDWRADLYAGFSARRGNTTEDAYQYGGSYDKKNSTLYRYLLRLDGRYRQTNDRRTESRTEVSAEIRRMLDERWFVAGKSSMLYDELRDLRPRVRVGPLLGRYLADCEKLTADVSTGPLYVYERTSADTEHSLAWRVEQNVRLKMTETLDLWSAAHADMDVQEPRDYNLTVRAGMDVKINSRLKLTVMVKNEYENQPQGGPTVKKNDFEISTGLRFVL